MLRPAPDPKTRGTYRLYYVHGFAADVGHQDSVAVSTCETHKRTEGTTCVCPPPEPQSLYSLHLEQGTQVRHGCCGFLTTSPRWGQTDPS